MCNFNDKNQFLFGAVFGRNPLKKLHAAVQKSDLAEISSIAASEGTGVFEESDKVGCTALHHAVRLRSAGVVTALVRIAPAAALIANVDNETPFDIALDLLPSDSIITKILRAAVLHLAIERVRGEAARSILDCSQFYFYFILFFYYFFFSKGLVDLALRAVDNDSASKPDESGLLPLFKAAQFGSVQIVKKLLAQRSVGATDRSPQHGGTALHAATSSEVVRILIAAGAQPNATMDDGRTALHFAAALRDVAHVRLLIQVGVSVTLYTKHDSLQFGLLIPANSSALHVAVASNRGLDIVSALVDAGADVRQVNRLGLSPCDLLRDCHPSVRTYVLTCAADKRSVTPMMPPPVHVTPAPPVPSTTAAAAPPAPAVPYVEDSVLFLGRALCTYVANGANEVSVEKNAKLAVLSQHGSFYRVRTSVGDIGLFPSGLLTHVRRAPSNHDRAAAAAATSPQQLPPPPPVSAADAVAAAAVATASSNKSGAAAAANHFEFKMRIFGRPETFTVRLPIDALVQQLNQEVQHALARLHIDGRGMYILDKYNRRMDPKIAIGRYDLQREDDLSVILRVQSPTPIRTRASTGGIRAGNNASASPLPSAPQPLPSAARARPTTMSAMPLPISRGTSLPPIAKVERVAVAAAPVPLVVNGLTVSMFCEMFPDLPPSVVAEELAMIESGDEEEAVTALSALASVFGESLRSSSSDAFGSSDLRPANADESVLWFHDTERDGWQLFGPASVALLENGIVHGAHTVRLADDSTVDLQSMLWSAGNRSFVVRRELHLRANRGRSPSAPVGSVAAASAASAAVAAAPAFVGAPPPVAVGRRALSGDIVASKPNPVVESLDEELTWQSDDEPSAGAGAKSRGAGAAAVDDDDEDLDDDRVAKLQARRSSTPLSPPSTPSTPLDMSRGSPAQHHAEELDDVGKVRKLFNESISPHFRISFNELTEKPFSTLGEGAYGCVYRGIWRGADVAVKEIRPQRNGGKLMLEFVREAALMARIRSHSNLVTFLGACDDPLYIVTELMPNGSLRALLDRRDEPMDVALKLRILRDIARGMLHLSLEKVVHRDLAARNVLLGENYVAKVADFGLSRSLSDYAPVYTGHGGALAWLAPESLVPPCVFTTMSDVWMFGVTAIEVLTRQLPSPDQLPHQVAMRVINGELNHMDQLTTDVPAALREVLTRCFARSPEARPAFRELTTVISDELNPSAKSVVAAAAATPVRLDDYDDDGASAGASKPPPSKPQLLRPAVAPNAASRWSIDSVDDDDAINDPLPPLPPLPPTQE